MWKQDEEIHVKDENQPLFFEIPAKGYTEQREEIFEKIYQQKLKDPECAVHISGILTYNPQTKRGQVFLASSNLIVCKLFNAPRKYSCFVRLAPSLALEAAIS